MCACASKTHIQADISHLQSGTAEKRKLLFSCILNKHKHDFYNSLFGKTTRGKCLGQVAEQGARWNQVAYEVQVLL